MIPDKGTNGFFSYHIHSVSGGRSKIGLRYSYPRGRTKTPLSALCRRRTFMEYCTLNMLRATIPLDRYLHTSKRNFGAVSILAELEYHMMLTIVQS